MNVRLGVFALLAGVFAAATIACTTSNPSVTPTPTPVPSGSIAPDTLWVQDSTGLTVRSYKGASQINGGVLASVILPTNDNARPDIPYDPASDTLWYPNQTNPNGTNNSIYMWKPATTLSLMPPTVKVATADTNNLEGAAVFDSTHNGGLLIVAHNTGNTVDLYTNATALGAAQLPAGFVTLNMTDGGVVGTPRPQEMLYDALHDRLFVVDNGTICAKFDNFYANAAGPAITGSTTIPISSTTQITGLGLGQGTGLAYNNALDYLFVTEISPPEIDVIKVAGTFNGNPGHGEVLTNFLNPTGLAYDQVRDILFVYDAGVSGQSGSVAVFPNGSTVSGNQLAWLNRRVIFDLGVALSGFGLTVDTTH